MPVETLSDTLMGRCVTPISEDHGDKYGVPSLEELGENSNAHTCTYTRADLDRLDKYLTRILWILTICKTNL